MRKPTYSLRRTDQLSKAHRNPKHAALHAAMDEICRKENNDTLSFWVSVEAEMRRYGLYRRIATATIINESYVRGIKTIDSGKAIPNPFAWLRLTCRYIICEKQRYHQRNMWLGDTEALLSAGNVDFDLDEENDRACAMLTSAIEELPILEQTILSLKVVEKHKWTEIPSILQQLDLGEFSVDALKKRKERACKRVRQSLADGG